MERRIITGFTDLYIAKKITDGRYTTPEKLRGSRSVVFQVDREIQTVRIGRGQAEKEILNKINKITIETEVYDPKFEIIKMLEHGYRGNDKYNGITTTSYQKDDEYAIMLIRTDNYNKKEYMILYNCKVKILDTIDAEVKGAKPFLISGRATTDSNDIIRYLNSEENILEDFRAEFDELFRSVVYYPTTVKNKALKSEGNTKEIAEVNIVELPIWENGITPLNETNMNKLNLKIEEIENKVLDTNLDFGTF